ncbi:MAG TPA: N-acetyltransferase family protein [Candidatus Sumerlaeota bacterium]|nr:N-acetyltransferase family protein [Candidatus Sumerlaeota bacterium]
MEFILKPLSEEHRRPVVDIFNYYVENSFAAYPEAPLPCEFFDRYLNAASRYPAFVAEAPDGRIAGFGLLRPHHLLPTFAHTAELTYFILPEFTRCGLGTRLLDRLIEDARPLGITILLASISSLNPASLAFHLKHGFIECGRFPGIGRKNGHLFDVVWMQRTI